MNPTILGGVIGPGFLNQVPTLPYLGVLNIFVPQCPLNHKS